EPRWHNPALGPRQGGRARHAPGPLRAGWSAGVPARRTVALHRRGRRLAPPLGCGRRPRAGRPHPGASGATRNPGPRRRRSPAGSTSNAPKLWDTATHRELDLLAVEPTDARVVVFTPDGRSLATAGGPVNLCGLDAERPLRTFKGTTGLTRSIAVSPAGSMIA